MQKGEKGWFETKLNWEVISIHHIPVIGGVRRRKLPLRSLLVNMYHATFPGKVLPHCAFEKGWNGEKPNNLFKCLSSSFFYKDTEWNLFQL